MSYLRSLKIKPAMGYYVLDHTSAFTEREVLEKLNALSSSQYKKTIQQFCQFPIKRIVATWNEQSRDDDELPEKKGII